MHSDADTATVSQEVIAPVLATTNSLQAVKLRTAFHEARNEADKITGSNLGIKEQEIVIAKLTEQVTAKRFVPV